MLVGGGVKHHIGPVFSEHRIHSCRIFHIANHAIHRSPGKLLLDAVERELGLLKEHQRPRIEADDLTAQFGADGPPGTGDEHGFPGQLFLEPGLVEQHLFASEQILKLDLSHFSRRHATGQHIR